jgi:hypothetical protein
VAHLGVINVNQGISKGEPLVSYALLLCLAAHSVPLKPNAPSVADQNSFRSITNKLAVSATQAPTQTWRLTHSMEVAFARMGTS